MSDSSEWWSTFFHGLPVEMWQRIESPEQTKTEADYIARRLDPKPGAALLDVPCGAGRHALDLASRGFHVTGVDISPEFLAAARRRAAERGVAASFEEREMRDLPWREAFDGAYCFGNSFPYLDDGGNPEFIRRVHAALKPGSRFVLETGYVLESLLPNLEKRAWYPVGLGYWLAERRHDAARGRIEVKYTLIDGARIETKHSSVRTYALREIVRLFEEADFEVLSREGGLDGAPYETGAACLYVVARKR